MRASSPAPAASAASQPPPPPPSTPSPLSSTTSSPSVHVLGNGVIYVGGVEPDDLYLCRSWLELSRRQEMEHGQLDGDGQLIIYRLVRIHNRRRSLVQLRFLDVLDRRYRQKKKNMCCVVYLHPPRRRLCRTPPNLPAFMYWPMVSYMWVRQSLVIFILSIMVGAFKKAGNGAWTVGQ